MQGNPLPETSLQIMGKLGPESAPANELFTGNCIVFGVPGAFTPTCSEQHLPGYHQHADAFRTKGVDRIACIAVNDVFVMHAWGAAQAATDDVLMVADGNADFARAMGLESDASEWGMGIRCKRFAMHCKDGIIRQLWVEAPGSYGVSSAEAVLGKI